MNKLHAAWFLILLWVDGALEQTALAGPPKEAASPAKTPYEVQVVVHIVENRFLTPLFQQQLERDIEDRLQAVFGPLAKVKTTRTHSLLAEIEAEGLGKTLDVWDQLSSTRTCFVLVEYAAGRYRLQVRQHDGLTGLASPVARQVQISDRARLAQTAVDLIRRDFGLVGSVASVSGDEVTLTIHGGELAKDLSDWVQPGQVFAVCRVALEGESVRSTRLPWTLLEALPGGADKGQVRCRLLRRFAGDDLQPGPGVPPVRCLLLPRAKAPLRLRFLDDKTLEPKVGIAVVVRRPPEKELKGSTDPSGLVEFKEEIANLALVVLPSGTREQRVPVAIVDDRIVVVALRTDADAEERVGLDYRVRLWERRIVDNLRLNSERIREINEQILRSFEQALETARHASKGLGEELGHLEREHADIGRWATKVKVAVDMARGEAILRELKERHKEMQERVGRYEEAAKEAKEDKAALGLKSLVEKAKLHEDLAEFDQALAAYDAALKVSPELSKVRAYVDKLRAAWTIKGEGHKRTEHERARTFIYEVWPKLEALDLDKHLPEMRRALTACKEAGDTLAPLRIMRANVGHAAKVHKKREELEKIGSDESRTQAKIIQRVAGELLEVENTARLLAGKKVAK